MPVVEQAKKEAKRLLRLCEAAPGHQLQVETLAQAQEVISRIRGFPDWHAFQTRTARADGVGEPVSPVSEMDSATTLSSVGVARTLPERRYLRSDCEAAWTDFAAKFSAEIPVEPLMREPIHGKRPPNLKIGQGKLFGEELPANSDLLIHGANGNGYASYLLEMAAQRVKQGACVVCLDFLGLTDLLQPFYGAVRRAKREKNFFALDFSGLAPGRATHPFQFWDFELGPFGSQAGGWEDHWWASGESWWAKAVCAWILSNPEVFRHQPLTDPEWIEKLMSEEMFVEMLIAYRGSQASRSTEAASRVLTEYGTQPRIYDDAVGLSASASATLKELRRRLLTAQRPIADRNQVLHVPEGVKPHDILAADGIFHFTISSLDKREEEGRYLAGYILEHFLKAAARVRKPVHFFINDAPGLTCRPEFINLIRQVQNAGGQFVIAQSMNKGKFVPEYAALFSHLMITAGAYRHEAHYNEFAGLVSQFDLAPTGLLMFDRVMNMKPQEGALLKRGTGPNSEAAKQVSLYFGALDFWLRDGKMALYSYPRASREADRQNTKRGG